jgi:hypothetical protein
MFGWLLCFYIHKAIGRSHFFKNVFFGGTTLHFAFRSCIKHVQAVACGFGFACGFWLCLWFLACYPLFVCKPILYPIVFFGNSFY